MARFGDETAGGDDFPCSGDRGLLSRFELTEAGDVSEVVVRFAAVSAAGTTMKGLIYADGTGVPGARVAIGAAVAVPAGGGLVSSATTASLAAGFYWLGFVADGSDPRAQGDVGGSLSRMEGTTYASPAATWTQSGTGGMGLNVYAEYTPSAPPVDVLFYRNLFTRKPRGGSASWSSASPASALLLAEFFEPAAPGVPTYSRAAVVAALAHNQAGRGFIARRAGVTVATALQTSARSVRLSRTARQANQEAIRAARVVRFARVSRHANQEATRAARVLVARRSAELREAPGVVSARLVRFARAAILAAQANTQATGGVAAPGVNTYTRAAAIHAAASSAAARLLRGNRSASVTETVSTRATRVKVTPRPAVNAQAPHSRATRTLVAPRAARIEAAPLARASRQVTATRAQSAAQAVASLSTARFVVAIRSAIMDVASPSAIVARALRAVRLATLAESPATAALGGVVSANVLPGVGWFRGVTPPRVTARDAVALRAVGASILARVAPPSLSALTPPRLERIP